MYQIITINDYFIIKESNKTETATVEEFINSLEEIS